MNRIHFDHQAGCTLLPEVVEAMLPWLHSPASRPSALHHFGLQSKKAIDQSRQSLARLIGAKREEEILFTASSTEALNLAIKGCALANRKRGNHLIACPLDSPAVLRSLEWLRTQGFETTLVESDGLGRIHLDPIKHAIQSETCLIVMHWAQADLGVLQNIPAITSIARDQAIPIVIDAEAAMGWTDIDVAALGISCMTFSPSTFHGPKGCGVLYRKTDTPMEPILHGGDEEFGVRPGEQNVVGIVGAGKAADLLMERREEWRRQAGAIQEILWNRLQSEVRLIQLHGPPPGPLRLPNHLNFSMEFVEGEGLALFLDMKGISVHTGAACTMRSMRIPPAFKAIGVPESLAQSNLLLTWDGMQTPDHANQTVDWILKGVERMRGLSPGWEDYRQGRFPALLS